MEQSPLLAPDAAPKTIVLVGLMGAGKSTVGKRLAARLHLPFVDADHEVEAAAGCTISDIFERYGEAGFRDGERRVIARLMRGPRKVLATGGGAFVHPDTRALILAEGLAIWLDADITVLAERVARREGRPLLKGRNAFDVLSELAAVRNPIYAQAHLRIASEPLPHEATVNSILEALAA